MATRRILMSAMLLLPMCGVAKSVQPLQQIPPAYHQIAAAARVPAESLYSLALTESSRRLPYGERPWPWTINVAGKGYRFETREAAWQALLQFVRKYPLKRIDVGIAQVNLGWNGQRFMSTWEALDPYVNLNAAAAILRECWDRKPGSWLDTAGCYHHPAGGAPAARYRAFVKSKLAMLQSSPHLPAATVVEQTASASVPDSGLVWINPRSQ